MAAPFVTIFGEQDREQGVDRVEDFVARYEDGAPYEGFDGDEALQRYQQVVAELPPAEYRAVATEAFRSMGEPLRQRLRGILTGTPAETAAVGAANPTGAEALADLATRVNEETLGGLAVALVGRSSVATEQGFFASLDDPAVKSALAGIAAVGAKRLLGVV